MTTNEELIEEVAQDMYGEALPGRDWTRAPEDVRQHWRRYARVALDAAFDALAAVSDTTPSVFGDAATLADAPKEAQTPIEPTPINGKWVCGKCAREVARGHDDDEIPEHHRTCPKRITPVPSEEDQETLETAMFLLFPKTIRYDGDDIPNPGAADKREGFLAGVEYARGLTPPAPVDRESALNSAQAVAWKALVEQDDIAASQGPWVATHAERSVAVAQALADAGLLAVSPAPAHDWSPRVDHVEGAVAKSAEWGPSTPAPARDEWDEHVFYGTQRADGVILREPRGPRYATHRQIARFNRWEPLPVTEEERDG